MSDTCAGSNIANDAVATLMRAAGLHIEEDRFEATAALLEAAAAAASHLDKAAASVPLDEALAEFDPSWREGGR